MVGETCRSTCVASQLRKTRCREDLLTQIKQLPEALDRLRLQIFLESSEPRLPDVPVSSQLSRHNNGLPYRNPCETPKRKPTLPRGNLGQGSFLLLPLRADLWLEFRRQLPVYVTGFNPRLLEEGIKLRLHALVAITRLTRAFPD